jgi:hypothetical protein
MILGIEFLIVQGSANPVLEEAGAGNSKHVVGEFERLVLGHLAHEMSTLANTVEAT